MNVLGHTCFRYLEKKWKFFSRKLPNIMYYTEFYKTTLRHVKTTTFYLYLENYIVMKFSVKLVSHWVIYCVDRNCKYRHINLQAIFHIVWLISNCPYNNYREAILTVKMLLSNMAYRRHTLIIESWGLSIVRCRRHRKQIKSCTKNFFKVL